MHHLGIPTTRAGLANLDVAPPPLHLPSPPHNRPNIISSTVVTSDSRVVRDIHYNGNAIMERCTVVLRIAETFLRFGSFEIFKDTDATTGRRGPSAGREDLRKQLLDYVVQSFYPTVRTGAESVFFVPAHMFSLNPPSPTPLHPADLGAVRGQSERGHVCGVLQGGWAGDMGPAELLQSAISPTTQTNPPLCPPFRSASALHGWWPCGNV